MSLMDNPAFKRAAGLFIQQADDIPAAPMATPRQSDIDEFEAAMTAPRHRTVKQVVQDAPGPNLEDISTPQGMAAPVDANGNVTFPSIYAAANIPTVAFPAENAIEMLKEMPSGVPLPLQRQMLQVTLKNIGNGVGATPNTIVADAARKQAALESFVTDHGNQLADLQTAANASISDMEKKIALQKTLLQSAQTQHDKVMQECHDESVRLDAVIEFFTLDTGQSKMAPPNA